MKKNMLLMSVLTLGTLSMAVAGEYVSPDVGFKPHAVPSKEMKTADFGDHYRVESGPGTDRQIASEESDREPSSISKDKVEVDENVPVDSPKPWLFKIETGGTK
ncbi:MAG: hypothetical protein K2Q18_11375 [Bdellovibrionales bacterium]|nr:hypothetical protein [Bdellovibrionales bacterium]